MGLIEVEYERGHAHYRVTQRATMEEWFRSLK
jgi:hypothetical protein